MNNAFVKLENKELFLKRIHCDLKVVQPTDVKITTNSILEYL